MPFPPLSAGASFPPQRPGFFSALSGPGESWGQPGSPAPLGGRQPAGADSPVSSAAWHRRPSRLPLPDPGAAVQRLAGGAGVRARRGGVGWGRVLQPQCVPFTGRKPRAWDTPRPLLTQGGLETGRTAPLAQASSHLHTAACCLGLTGSPAEHPDLLQDAWILTDLVKPASEPRFAHLRNGERV